MIDLHPCLAPCDHTILEHLAFDAGWWMAQHGGPRDACQLTGLLRDAWEWGWDYGQACQDNAGT